jgi:hypothetical protein
VVGYNIAMVSFQALLRPALAVLSFAGIGWAQAAPPIELREVASTVAMGGDIRRIVVAADETRFLTVGELGDILWWDLGKRELLRRVEPFARHLAAVAIHPTENWAVVAASSADEAERAVFALDLATGDVRKILDLEVDHLAFSASGESLGALQLKLLGERRFGMFEQRALTFVSKDLQGASGAEPRASTAFEPWSRKRVHFPTPDGHAVAVPYGPRNGEYREPCQSHRGTARGHHKWTRLQRFAPEPAIYSLAAQIDNWIDLTAITDTGTMLAADQQGQLFVQGLAADDLTVRSGHRGEAHALTFSPDGKFVAVQGLGAVRFVGLDGREVAFLHGTHLVRPGADGADFWILGRHELRLWNAKTNRVVGEPQRWPQPTLPLLRSNELRSLPDLRGRPVYGPQNLWTLAAFVVVDGQPWAGSLAKGLRSAEPVRRTANGQFERLPDAGDRGDAAAFLVASDGNVVSAAGRRADELIRASSGSVRIYARDGGAVALRRFQSAPLWLAVAGDVVLLGTSNGEVHRLRGSDLEEIDRRTFTPRLRQLVAFDGERLLASSGPSLQLLAARNLEVLQTLSLPAELDGVDVFGLAPDRRHIAVARGADVRILAIE